MSGPKKSDTAGSPHLTGVKGLTRGLYAPTSAGVSGGENRRGAGQATWEYSGMAGQDASPACDSQQQGGREPGWCGKVNIGEALVNVVMSNKRKLLTRLGQKGTWSGPAAILSIGADAAPPAKRRDLTHTATTTERGKPVASPGGPPRSPGTANRKASLWGCG